LAPKPQILAKTPRSWDLASPRVPQGPPGVPQGPARSSQGPARVRQGPARVLQDLARTWAWPPPTWDLLAIISRRELATRHTLDAQLPWLRVAFSDASENAKESRLLRRERHRSECLQTPRRSSTIVTVSLLSKTNMSEDHMSGCGCYISQLRVQKVNASVLLR